MQNGTVLRGTRYWGAGIGGFTVLNIKFCKITNIKCFRRIFQPATFESDFLLVEKIDESGNKLVVPDGLRLVRLTLFTMDLFIKFA